MEKYQITGMSCAACSRRVETAVSAVEGVEQCTVNLLTNSMVLEGTAKSDDVMAAVQNAGYGIQRIEEATTNETNHRPNSQVTNHTDAVQIEIQHMKQRFIASLVFLIVLMYFSMGYMMWHFPVPAFFEKNDLAVALLELLLTICVMVINKKFFINGCKGIVHRAPNMDTLVAVGATAAFVYSTVVLFRMTNALRLQQIASVRHLAHNLYFESTAMILTLITVGKYLETKAKGRTTDALQELIQLAPENAIVIRDGKETTIPVSKMRVKDIFVVKPGGSIPCDGVVIEGESVVDESSFTGESIPVDKHAGDAVSQATINQAGFIKCEAVHVGNETAFAKMIQMVEEASATKAPIAKLADQISGVFVPIVLGIAFVTFVVWLCLGKDVGFSIARAVSVLVISCPCALGLATPVAIMVGNGQAAKHNILFKSAETLENMGKTQIAVFDKTGTITKGNVWVADVYEEPGAEKELYLVAEALEKHSEHPLAQAIMKHEKCSAYAKDEQMKISDIQILPGNGIVGRMKDNTLVAGNKSLICQYVKLSESVQQTAERFANEGKTPVYVASHNKLLGIFALADKIKDDSAQAVADLRQMGVDVVMLTGDHENTAQAVAKQVGIDTVYAQVLPDEKANIIKQLMKRGRVMMVGDGINDAVSLASADIGVAIGAGTQVAVSAADVVLMKNSLMDACKAIYISRKTLKNIKENLFWAFVYNMIGIPLAAGVFIPAFGWQLNPMFAAAAMSLSSFCVVSNALRLKGVRYRVSGENNSNNSEDDGNNDSNSNGIKNSNVTNNSNNNSNMNKKECSEMKKTIVIEGMMCSHCEAAVKSALEAIDGVNHASVSHNEGTAVVTMDTDIDEDILRKTVEAKDYTVKEIK